MTDKSKSESAKVEFKKFDNEEIDGLVQEGIKSYALQEYDDASEKFAKACEVFATTNDGKDDGDLLLIYGKALYQLAVSKSEVLGANTSQQQKTKEQPKEEAAQAEGSNSKDTKEEDESGEKEEKEEKEEAAEEEESDLEFAWGVLDSARKLFSDQLEMAEAGDKSRIQKNLADVLDILGEVSLESENFHQAVEDLSESLKLKNELYEFTDPLVSEAHFKLGIAYEYDHENENHKDKAISHMEKAIDSVKKSGKDDPELIKDLEIRLEDLKSQGPSEKEDVLDGILGKGDGGSLKDQLMSMVGQATDINSLVRKKPTDGSDQQEPPAKKQK